MNIENLFKGFFTKKEKNVKEKDAYILIKEKKKNKHKHVNYYFKNKES